MPGGSCGMPSAPIFIRFITGPAPSLPGGGGREEAARMPTVRPDPPFRRVAAQRRIVHRLLHLRTALAHHQRVHRELLGLAVQRQLEAFRQQILQHHLELLFGGALGDLGDDVEALAVQPLRAADLISLDRRKRSSGRSSTRHSNT